MNGVDSGRCSNKRGRCESARKMLKERKKGGVVLVQAGALVRG